MTTSTLTVESSIRDDVATSDWPGRWLGGLIGAVASLAAAIALYLLERPTDDFPGSIVGGPTYPIALLGIPIAFVLGRAAFPSIRRGGWGWALIAGSLIGLAAPPLGAIEILFGPTLLPLDPGSIGQLGLILFLPVAFLFSYAVVWITLPVGVVTALAIRALPADVPPRFRTPPPAARLGVRHAVVALVLWAIVVQAGTAVLRR